MSLEIIEAPAAETTANDDEIVHLSCCQTKPGDRPEYALCGIDISDEPLVAQAQDRWCKDCRHQVEIAAGGSICELVCPRQLFGSLG